MEVLIHEAHLFNGENFVLWSKFGSYGKIGDIMVVCGDIKKKTLKSNIILQKCDLINKVIIVYKCRNWAQFKLVHS